MARRPSADAGDVPKDPVNPLKQWINALGGRVDADDVPRERINPRTCKPLHPIDPRYYFPQDFTDLSALLAFVNEQVQTFNEGKQQGVDMYWAESGIKWVRDGLNRHHPLVADWPALPENLRTPEYVNRAFRDLIQFVQKLGKGDEGKRKGGRPRKWLELCELHRRMIDENPGVTKQQVCNEYHKEHPHEPKPKTKQLRDAIRPPRKPKSVINETAAGNDSQRRKTPGGKPRKIYPPKKS